MIPMPGTCVHCLAPILWYGDAWRDYRARGDGPEHFPCWRQK